MASEVPTKDAQARSSQAAESRMEKSQLRAQSPDFRMSRKHHVTFSPFTEPLHLPSGGRSYPPTVKTGFGGQVAASGRADSGSGVQTHSCPWTFRGPRVSPWARISEVTLLAGKTRPGSCPRLFQEVGRGQGSCVETSLPESGRSQFL